MVPHRVERKLAAILSADVCGYSRLMGDDDVATVQTLKAYRQLMAIFITQHRGRVVDAPGDNLLAEFASVVEAVRCAVAIQGALAEKNAELAVSRKMEFRIGLNLGEVIIEEEQIYGEGVNVAARLESLAEAGGICISGLVHDQIEKKLTLAYEYLGEQTVKNIAKPVPVYRILLEPPAVRAADRAEPSPPCGHEGAGLPDQRSLGVVLVGSPAWRLQNGHATPSAGGLATWEETEQHPVTLLEEEVRLCSCGHGNPTHAVFCGHCGAPLTAELPCPGCGGANPAGLRFCRGCGTRLSVASAAVQERFREVASVSAADGAQPPRPRAHSLDRLANDVFVGREQELDGLRAHLEETLAGHGRTVVLLGEPGIGKTRTATELATYAQLRGARVLIARCYDGEGAPPFWPWVQLIRTYVAERDPASLKSEMGPGAADIAQVIAEVRDRLPALPTPATLEPDQARFRLFDSVAMFLKRVARRQPLVVLFEDLQWADTASLLLLQFVARELAESRLFIVVTCRDGEIEQPGPLTQTLGALARLLGNQTVVLQRLSAQDVTRFMELTTGHVPSEGLAGAVYQRTEGHPFFMTEVVRLLAMAGDQAASSAVPCTPVIPLPLSVRSVIERRLAQLSAECRHMLTIAAVIGREFDLSVLEMAGVHAAHPGAGAPGEALTLALLDEAITAHLITSVPQSLGRYSFSHALIRETLYEGLTLTQRSHLHRCSGAALETVVGDHPEPLLAELAHHFFAATQDGQMVAKAVDYACRAAEQATAALAYEDAALHYEHALHALARQGTDPHRHCALVLALGEAQRRAGNLQRARESFQQATALARGLRREGREDATAFLVRAALGSAELLTTPTAERPASLSLLEEALEALGGEESIVRVRMMARLAEGFYYVDRKRHLELSAQAFAMATRLGDPSTLAVAFDAQRYAIAVPDNLAERLALSREMVQRGEAAGDPRLTLVGHLWSVSDFLEHGDLEAIDREMAAHARLAEHVRLPLYRWHAALFRAMRALMSGHFAEGERLAREALMLGQRAQDHVPRMLFGIQLYQLRTLQGRCGELLDVVREAIAQHPKLVVWRCALAYLYSVLGRKEDARGILLPLLAENCAGIPWDLNWLTAMTLAAETCAVLEDEEGAGVLYEKLLPYRRQNVVVGAAIAFYGPGAYYLGRLATTLGRFAEAEQHFAEALALTTAMGARPFVAATQYAYAAMLLKRNEPCDQERAAVLLEQALTTTQELGMAGLEEQVTSLQTRSQYAITESQPEEEVYQTSLPGTQDSILSPQSSVLSPQPSALPTPSLFRCDGDYWTISYQGTTCRVKDLRGLHYLASLLRHPHHEFYAVELASKGTDAEGESLSRPRNLEPGEQEPGGVGFGDAGILLDPQARAAYKRRVQDLREELEEARSCHDPGRTERVQAELEFLTHELARAVGLGGRQRLAASAAERARTSLTHAIKAALRKISDHHPALGQHLSLTVKTGVRCAYTPDPGLSMTWQI